jgi:hypothetical protein
VAVMIRILLERQKCTAAETPRSAKALAEGTAMLSRLRRVCSERDLNDGVGRGRDAVWARAEVSACVGAVGVAVRVSGGASVAIRSTGRHRGSIFMRRQRSGLWPTGCARQDSPSGLGVTRSGRQPHSPAALLPRPRVCREGRRRLPRIRRAAVACERCSQRPFCSQPQRVPLATRRGSILPLQ